MASGVQHRNASLVLAGSVFVSSLFIGHDAGISFPLTLGCLAGIVISPDLDIDGTTISEAIVFKIPIVGWLFYWFWMPYAVAIPHRGRISHIPFISTFFRVLYMTIGVNLLVLALYAAKILSSEHVGMYISMFTTLPFWLFVYGLCLSDVCHWAADGFPF